MPSNKKKKLSPRKKNTFQGKIFLHQKGFGFVRPEKASPQDKDVFIPKKWTQNAIDQDFVKVEITSEASPKGPEGKVVEILQRTRSEFTGVIFGKTHAHFEVFVASLGSEQTVLVKKNKKVPLKIGDRILLGLSQKKKQFFGTLIKKIGSITNASTDSLFFLHEFGIRKMFPKKCLQEAQDFGKTVKKQDRQGRLDLTHLNSMTIDPVTAKDFDDALSITVDEKNHYHLGVHIADAAFYVKADTELDKEAKKRANSTYFPNECVPMLPEHLSNGLCSLKPNVIRLAVSILMHFDEKGALLEKTIKRSFIKSKKRWSYPEALSCLEGKKKSPYKKDLENLKDLAMLLKKQRQMRGSIDFSLTDTKILIAENGEPKGIVKEEYDVTHQLVEEFMLKANELVALTLSDSGHDLIYRIHEEPNSDNFADFLVTAKSLGFSLEDPPTDQEIQKLFQEARHSPHFQRLSLSFIKAMKLACYSKKNIGHYGLKLSHYAHFTSPIRRYADLTVQRILFGEMEAEDLDEIASYISDQERNSMKAENAVIFLKKLRLIQKIYKKDPNKKYLATITSVKPYAIFFEIQDVLIEGSLHISQIGRDFFVFCPRKNALVGERTKTSYSFGTEIFVKVKEVDLTFQQAKFSLC